MSNRIVLGRRSNGDMGIFIAPAGVNAMTAADSALILNVSSKVTQLLLMGRVTASGTIAIGTSRSPFVIVTSQYNFSGVIGHTAGPGPLRPSPAPGGTSPCTCTVNGNGASITLNISIATVFQVYSQAFT